MEEKTTEPAAKKSKNSDKSDTAEESSTAMLSVKGMAIS